MQHFTSTLSSITDEVSPLSGPQSRNKISQGEINNLKVIVSNEHHSAANIHEGGSDSEFGRAS